MASAPARPTGRGDLQPVSDQMAAGAFDDAGDDRPAALQSLVVAQELGVARQVADGRIDASGGPSPLPQLFEHVDHIDDDVNAYVAAGGFGTDEVELMAGAADQHHPGPSVEGARASTWSNTFAITSSGPAITDPHGHLRLALGPGRSGRVPCRPQGRRSRHKGAAR